jgi:hypothetical protein
MGKVNFTEKYFTIWAICKCIARHSVTMGCLFNLHTTFDNTLLIILLQLSTINKKR